jgi:hypothetical protein
MHFEVPKAKSFKEFGGEYLMIVISIVTALALEHAVQSWHHRHVAHEAAVKIDSELRLNVKEIDKVLEHNNAEKRKLKVLRKDLLEAIQAKVDDAVLMARFNKDSNKGLNLSIRSASLRREAWEAAVASQAVSWMPQEALERYSNVYATMRDVQAIEIGGFNHFLDAPRYLDTLSNLQMGQSNPRDIFRMLNQMISAYESGDGNLANLRGELEAAANAGGH